MADVVVVGAGVGGLAIAARLAKLGHGVTVCERGSAPGGLLRQVSQEGFTWDAVPAQLTLPAVLRDLFRKSGRPLERYVDLSLSAPARRHVFGDGRTLDMPTGSRHAQLDAVGQALGPAAAREWTRFVDAQSDVWDVVRARVLDNPHGAAALADCSTARALHTRQSLDSLLRKALDVESLRLVGAYPVSRTGLLARHAPSFRAVQTYVERTFGVWTIAGGAGALSDVLLTRLRERAVELKLGSEVAALSTSGDRVTGVTLLSGRTLAADIVVTAISPEGVFSCLLDSPVARSTRSLLRGAGRSGPRSATYLGLAHDVPVQPVEVVLHGDPLLVVSTGGAAPDNGTAWTVVTVGTPRGDVLDEMARRGLDIRHAVITRLDAPSSRRPASGAAVGGRSALRHAFGSRSAALPASAAQPLPGLFCLGTGLVLGSSLPYVAWQAAHVADVVGKA